MNWKIPRSELYPDVVYITTSNIKSNREKILSEINSTCRYCGGVFYKYMICIKIDNKLDMCCRLCYKITHLNIAGTFQEVKLYYSTKSQLEIVRNTTDYIMKYNRIPIPQEIDKDILKTPISMFEYTNILLSNKKDLINNIIKDYKIFFTNKLDITYVIANYNSHSMFIDDSIEESIENHNKTPIQKLKISDKEKNKLIDFFET